MKLEQLDERITGLWTYYNAVEIRMDCSNPDSELMVELSGWDADDVDVDKTMQQWVEESKRFNDDVWIGKRTAAWMALGILPAEAVKYYQREQEVTIEGLIMVVSRKKLPVIEHPAFKAGDAMMDDLINKLKSDERFQVGCMELEY